MAKKNGKVKESRVTAASILIGVLSRANVPTDLEIISLVKKETGSELFDAKQLAWYKWKFRQGKLKGMDGKLHTINQKEKPAVRKAARKIVVKKSKKAKELVAA